MEFGNGWSLATDGVWQRMELAELGVLTNNNALCPMPHAQCPILSIQQLSTINYQLTFAECPNYIK
jgi:hypothetical protein